MTTIKWSRFTEALAISLVLLPVHIARAHAAVQQQAWNRLLEIFNSSSTSTSTKIGLWHGLQGLNPQANLPMPSTSTVTAMISSSTGGQLARSDKATLIVPRGALTSNLAVTISTPTIRLAQEEDLKARKLAARNLVAASDGVNFGPEGTIFLFPATVTLPYDPVKAQRGALHEMDLQVYHWNPDKQEWQWLSSTVDLTNHTVSARTMHLSLYLVAGRPAPAPATQPTPAPAPQAQPAPAHSQTPTVSASSTTTPAPSTQQQATPPQTQTPAPHP